MTFEFENLEICFLARRLRSSWSGPALRVYLMNLLIVSKIIDTHAPLKRLSRTQKSFHNKPWINKEISTLIKKKRNMYKTHFLQGDLAQKAEYKNFSNRLIKLKTNAKRNYIDSQLKIFQCGAKKTWKLLRSLLPSRSKTSNQTFNTQSINHQPN